MSYTYGDCTDGMKRMFPELPDDLGNAKEWADNARARGLPVISAPAPNTIVVYGAGQGYNEFGHVAAVESVNADGTFLVREMNFSGWNVWDERTSSMKDVIGFIVPPGTPMPDVSLLSSGGQGCNTFAWNVFGSNLCFDGLVGGFAILGGIGLVVTGVVLLTIAVLHSTAGQETIKVQRAITPKAPSKGRVRARASSNRMESRPAVDTTAESPEVASAARVRKARERAAQPPKPLISAKPTARQRAKEAEMDEQLSTRMQTRRRKTA